MISTNSVENPVVQDTPCPYCNASDMERCTSIVDMTNSKVVKRNNLSKRVHAGRIRRYQQIQFPGVLVGLYCLPCINNHTDGEQCIALMDSENDCHCKCDSGIENLEGMSPCDVAVVDFVIRHSQGFTL